MKCEDCDVLELKKKIKKNKDKQMQNMLKSKALRPDCWSSHKSGACEI